MADTMDAKRFDGTLGNAKAIVAWCGGTDKAICGATYGFTDEQPGGLNLVETRNDAPFYVDVPAGWWVVKRGESLAVFDDNQFRIAFPDFGG